MKKTVFFIGFAILTVSCATTQQHVKGVQSIQLVKSSRSWDGRPLPDYKTGTPEITILRITIPPKQSLPLHKHLTINAGVLIKGELTVITESGAILHLKPNDPIVEVVDTWHYGKNEGDVPAEIIVFYAGNKDEPITVKKQKIEMQHDKESTH